MIGTIVRGPLNPSGSASKRNFKVGDTVIATSTDYRDKRKATFQSYVLASVSNITPLPETVPPTVGAAVGVAYVAAAIVLGVCLGIDFSSVEGGKGKGRGPDLLGIISRLADEELPRDTLAECRQDVARLKRGGRQGEQGKSEWIIIWGSSTTGYIISQLARLAGFKVLLVVDLHKHGARLHQDGVDMLVDAHDPVRAIAVIRAVTGGELRYGVDTVGKETAGWLGDALESEDGHEEGDRHLVGLTGLPKEGRKGVVYHTVPIKLFHEIKEIGEGLMGWLEVLLAERLLKPPGVEVVEGGLESVNGALNRMRKGEISGKRVVVKIS